MNALQKSIIIVLAVIIGVATLYWVVREAEEPVVVEEVKTNIELPDPIKSQFIIHHLQIDSTVILNYQANYGLTEQQAASYISGINREARFHLMLTEFFLLDSLKSDSILTNYVISFVFPDGTIHGYDSK